MTSMYLDNIKDIPNGYILNQDVKTNQIVHHHGVKYQLIGKCEKKISRIEAIWLAVSSIFKTLLTFGYLMSFSELKHNLKDAFSRKKTISAYVKNENLPSNPGIPSNPGPSVPPNIVSSNPIPLNPGIGGVNSEEEKLKVFKADLQKIIDILKANKGDAIAQKKFPVYEKAMNLFIEKNCKVDLETFRLKNPDLFKIVYDWKNGGFTSLPSYLNEVFHSQNPLEIETTKGFYDYQSSDSSYQHVYVDYAHTQLGGGCFRGGFVMEEILVQESPDLAAHLAGHLNDDLRTLILVREGKEEKRQLVIEGSPNPYLMKKLTRVLNINSSNSYGSKIKKVSQKDLLDSAVPLDKPVKMDVIGVAAPRLFNQNTEDQWCEATLLDHTTTLMATFQLVKEQYEEKQMIHSGKLGCGVFNNDPHAIYLLHSLVAQHMGIKVKLYAFNSLEDAEYKKSWNEVAPQLVGKTLKDCIKTISSHLKKKNLVKFFKPIVKGATIAKPGFKSKIAI